MFKDYFEVRKWLESYIPQTYTKKELGLGRIKYLLKLLDNPQDKFKSIHVAGTSGKGSTAFYISRLLKESKSQRVKVGLHLSPHLVDIRERLQINGKLVPMNRFIKLLNEIKPVVEVIQKSKPELTPSYFEILVAASFLYFAQSKVDWAVVEVGLGGRLDATNVLNPEVSVIPNIGLDHTDILGKTIEEIAREKAGIIKSDKRQVTSDKLIEKGVPVVTGASGVALRVIENVAKEKKAKLITIGTRLGIQPLKSDIKDYLVIYRDILNSKKDFVTRAVFLLCIKSLSSLGIYPIRSQIIEAFSTPFAGRFEEIEPGVILDGAHNMEKSKALVSFLKNSQFIVHSSQFTVVIAFKKGKDWKGMLRLLIKELDIERIIATQFYAVTDTGPPSRKATEGQVPFAAVDPEEIADYVRSIVNRRSTIVNAISNSQEAVFETLDARRLDSNQLILVTGSLYLVGEVRTMWKLPEF